jgi:hypothetical protein
VTTSIHSSVISPKNNKGSGNSGGEFDIKINSPFSIDQRWMASRWLHSLERSGHPDQTDSPTNKFVGHQHKNAISNTFGQTIDKHRKKVVKVQNPGAHRKILSLTDRESISEEKSDEKWKKNEIGSKLFSNIEDLKKKSCFLQKPYRNSFKSCHQLPDQTVEEKMS